MIAKIMFMEAKSVRKYITKGTLPPNFMAMRGEREDVTVDTTSQPDNCIFRGAIPEQERQTV